MIPTTNSTPASSSLRAPARTAGKRGQFSKLKLGINSPQFLTVQPQQQQQQQQHQQQQKQQQK